MDMKKILQALDSANSKPVEGSNDMKKFVQIVNEGANPHKVALPVQMAMQHYQKPKKEKLEEVSVFRTYVAVVEDDLASQQADRKQLIRQYSQRIAESVLKKSLSERTLPGEETPPGINRLTGKPIEPEAPAAPAEKPPVVPLGSRYDPRFKNGPEPYTIDIGGKIFKFAGRDKQAPGTGEVIKVPAAVIGIRGLGAVNVELGADGMYYSAPKTDEALSEGKTEKKATSKPRNFVAKNAKMGGAGAHKDKKKAEKQGDTKHKSKMMDLAEMEETLSEIKKGQKDSNGFTKCWPGKHAEGTKKGKNGKPVRNCVPNEGVEESGIADDTIKIPGHSEHMKKEKKVKEAASAAQQAAIAISMKKAGKKPKGK